MKILAIETSCDETAISILEADGDLENPNFTVLAHLVSSQIKLHAEWGGVVPMLAKREHERNFTALLKVALEKANLLQTGKVNPEENDKNKKLAEILNREQELQELLIPFLNTTETPAIDAIAVTYGPGLEPALWVGINAAKALAYAWNKPLIPVNHMAGHIYSVLASDVRSSTSNKIEFPAIALLISGGHTELVLINNWLDHKIIGQTRDDAVGEAFDKVARLLDLPYPGGPEISKLAEQYKKQGNVVLGSSAQADGPSKEIFQQENIRADKNNIAEPIKLPRPMINSDDLDFSFSGLKTAVLYLVKKLKEEDVKSNPPTQRFGEAMPAIAHEFQQAAIDVLLSKTIKALDQHGAQSLIMGGGVVANTELRRQFTAAMAARSTPLHISSLELATDNATMIAIAGYLRFISGEPLPAPDTIVAKGNLSL